MRVGSSGGSNQTVKCLPHNPKQPRLNHVWSDNAPDAICQCGRARFDGQPISIITCQSCGFDWDALDGTHDKIRQAAKVNSEGPFCDLCRHLEMAERFARYRGMRLVWRLRRSRASIR